MPISHFYLLQTVTHENVDSDEMIRKFFFELVDTTMNLDNPNSHLDFLASSLPSTNVGQQVIKSLQDFLRVCISFNHFPALTILCKGC